MSEKFNELKTKVGVVLAYQLLEDFLVTEDLKNLDLDEWNSLYSQLPAKSVFKTTPFIIENTKSQTNGIEKLLDLYYLFPRNSKNAKLVKVIMTEQYTNQLDWFRWYKKLGNSEHWLNRNQEFCKTMIYELAHDYNDYEYMYKFFRIHEGAHYHFYEKMIELADFDQLIDLLENNESNCYYEKRDESAKKIVQRMMELANSYDDWRKIYKFTDPSRPRRNRDFHNQNMANVAMEKMAGFEKNIQELMEFHRLSRDLPEVESKIMVKLVQTEASFDEWLGYLNNLPEINRRSWSDNPPDKLKEFLVQKMESTADPKSFRHWYQIFKELPTGTGRYINALMKIINLAEEYEELVLALDSMPNDCVSKLNLEEKLYAKSKGKSHVELVDIYLANDHRGSAGKLILDHIYMCEGDSEAWEQTLAKAKGKGLDSLYYMAYSRLSQLETAFEARKQIYCELIKSDQSETRKSIAEMMLARFIGELTDMGRCKELYSFVDYKKKNEVILETVKYAKTLEDWLWVYHEMNHDSEESILPLKKAAELCESFDDWFIFYEAIPRWRFVNKKDRKLNRSLISLTKKAFEKMKEMVN